MDEGIKCSCDRIALFSDEEEEDDEDDNKDDVDAFAPLAILSWFVAATAAVFAIVEDSGTMDVSGSYVTVSVTLMTLR